MDDSIERREEQYAPAVETRSGLRRGTVFVALGAALAASAWIVRQRTLKAEREHPPIGRFIEVDGVRLHYVERGQGQPLLLLHGDGGMIQDFDVSGLIDDAAQNYRVIVFDRPGYGYSERPRNTVWTPQAQARLLHHALLQLNIERPIVLGHSWGTLVALSLALDFPEDVSSLVLLSGYYYPTARIDVPLLSLLATPIVGDVLRYTVLPLDIRMLWPALVRWVFSPAKVPQRFSKNFPAWMCLRPSQIRASIAETVLLLPAVFSLSKRYRELAMPVIMVAGANDRHVNTRTHSEHLHSELPQSELYEVRGAGHMIHHVAPRQVMKAIDRAAQASRNAIRPIAQSLGESRPA